MILTDSLRKGLLDDSVFDLQFFHPAAERAVVGAVANGTHTITSCNRREGTQHIERVRSGNNPTLPRRGTYRHSRRGRAARRNGRRETPRLLRLLRVWLCLRWKGIPPH